MRNLVRLASLTLTAALLPLLAVSTADAGETSASLDGLMLRPVNSASADVAAQAQEPKYVLGPASDDFECLDADLNTIGRNGTKVQLWTCNESAANQQWYVRKIPEGYYRFQNVASGRYLDADLNTIGRNGTVVQLWDDVAGAKNQWFKATTIPEGYLRLQNAYSGRYLDADLNTTGRNGTVVQLWDYVAGAGNQWWY
jgi:hypothetical protein